MKRIDETLWNWVEEDYGESKSKLHIFAFQTNDEWILWDHLLNPTPYDFETEEEAKEFYHNYSIQGELEELGFHDTPVPCEPIPGREYVHYTPYICGDFLVVVEYSTIDI